MIPPLKSNTGYKAKTWDTSSPFWQGKLEIVEDPLKETCEVVLSDPITGDLFAKAPYSKDGKGVVPVVDSSRYFAIRVLSDDGQAAVLGLGFSDQDSSYDFKVELQEFQKQFKAPAQIAASGRDFSLAPSQSEDIPASFTLLPPPSAKAVRQQKQCENQEAENDGFDDDFGDFEG